MQSEHLKLLADANLFKLSGNPYPGRGIVVGLDETGEYLVQVYWIMGRSPNSQNRVFGREGDRLFTEAADPREVKDPSLIIYNAMREYRDSMGLSLAIVSNGHQTDAVAKEGMIALHKYVYEPDAPNFTPRITGCSFWRRSGGISGAELSVLRKSPWDDYCDRCSYEYDELHLGYGYCITTYSGDGNPLPSFQGEPYLLPLVGGCNFIRETFWTTLNAQNRVAVAVKFIPKHGISQTFVINKYTKV